MKISKCKNEHFVDADKYSVCPICNAELKVSSSDVKIMKQAAGSDGTVSVYVKEKRAANSLIKTDVINENIEASPSSVSAGGLIQEEKVETPSVITHDLKAEDTPSLAQQVLKNSNSNAGKTVGFFQAGINGGPVIPSVPMGSSQSGLSLDSENSRLNARDFVAGILLCVKGPHFHECFAVCYGRNSIGRLDDNDIVLFKDNSVSREKHGWINFDQKSRTFSVQPGESSKFMYVDDQAVMQPMTLEPKSKIEVGDSVFVFVPFCDDGFNWEAYQNN